MEFYHDTVVSTLGPRPKVDGHPKGWGSFMTDDFSPIEFSWKWADTNEKFEPEVRFSIESIGDKAGTFADPWNQTATLEFVDQLRSSMPGIDLGWFDKLCDEALAGNNVGIIQMSDLQTHHSSLFLAFEFVGQSPMMKAYILPRARAIQTSKPISTIVCNALGGLAGDEIAWPALQEILSFLETRSQELQLEPFIIAVDCVAPSKARLKVYIRSPDTSLASVEAMMTMFDSSHDTAKGLEELRDLWQLVLGLDADISPQQNLPFKAHQTAGMLYYIEVRPGSARITPKVYIPVKHYGRNDLQIAQGLVTFFKSRHNPQDEALQNYMQVLEKICAHRSLDSACGLQTYVSCGIKNGHLDITSYLSPEIYTRGQMGRWISMQRSAGHDAPKKKNTLCAFF
jgi:DMATS type aromatic prenyltransferase